MTRLIISAENSNKVEASNFAYIMSKEAKQVRLLFKLQKLYLVSRVTINKRKWSCTFEEATQKLLAFDLTAEDVFNLEEDTLLKVNNDNSFIFLKLEISNSLFYCYSSKQKYKLTMASGIYAPAFFSEGSSKVKRLLDHDESLYYAITPRQVCMAELPYHLRRYNGEYRE